MATFKPVFPYVKSDGTSRVFIQMLHKRQRKLIKTEIYLTPEDLTRSGKIKSESIKDDVDALIKHYRDAVRSLGVAAERLNTDQLYDRLTNYSEDSIDFISYTRKIAEGFKKENRLGMYRLYNAAINSFVDFLNRDTIDINEITSKLLFDYATFLKHSNVRGRKSAVKKTGSRALSLYTGIYKAVINRAKREFNDEDHGIIKVYVSPFSKFKIPSEAPTRKRALSPTQIRMIRDIQLPENSNRATLARDCFMLSFYLCGINSADLYELPPILDGRITYKRKKTRTRRKDEAEISIKVEPEAMEILQCYSIKGKSIFNKRYSSPDNFNQAINKGLKQIGKMIGIPDLTFYAARHSWATIAVNDCSIDRHIVHRALNHVDTAMRVTDIYVKEDWSAIDRANKEVAEIIQV
ncbi:MAG: site-specific integrase [Bacteroidales bacterium]|nr:site-specific integrase [Bacteroidales bacterium]